MFIKFTYFLCVLSLLTTQSVFGDEMYTPAKGEHVHSDCDTKRPQEVVTVHKIQEPIPSEPNQTYYFPSWSKYVLPTVVAGSALAVSAVRATDSCDDPCGKVIDFGVLNFFVLANLGNSGEGGVGGTITVEILFPDGSVLDTITLQTTQPETDSQFSISTENFAPGQIFTVNVIAQAIANSITIDGRINGQVFDSQTQVFPLVGPLFSFTITLP